MNFFAQQLNDYFLESGKQLPPEVLAVLGKPFKGLNASEIEVYNRFIGPYQDRIRAALLDRLKQLGSPVREWSQQIDPYYRPIACELASQILGLESVPRLPETLAARTVYAPSDRGRGGLLQRFSLPHISLKWAIAVMVVVALLAAGGWWLFAATAPSRMLGGIEGEMERGEYALVLRHIEEMEEKYPGKAQTEEAEDLKPEAAMRYAEELYERARYEEAVLYYDIADSASALKDQALLGRANAYLAWAAALHEEGDNANAYECCESALACAPEGFDTTPTMGLRARILFSWGESLHAGGDYFGAAERFEKCYREWPAGPLADKALENYVDMTVAACTGNPVPGKAATAGGNVQIRISNQSDFTFCCYFSGPSTICFDLSPRERRTIYILPGVYNTAFVIERIGSARAVGEDFSSPTGSYSWWELILPSPSEVVPQGVSYEQIMARIEELKPSLPSQILECVEGLSYEQISGGGMLSDAMAEYDPNRKTVLFDPAVISPDEVDATIFHEWGHAYSDAYLDRDEKDEYMVLRDISPDIPWNDFDNYYLSVEEDFAEVFAVVFGNASWQDYTWYGPVEEVDPLREMMLEAAD